MKTVGVISIDPWFVLDDSDSLLNDLAYFDELVYDMRAREGLEMFCRTLPKGGKIFEAKLREIEALENAGLITNFNSLKIQNKKLDNKSLSYLKKTIELASGFLQTKKQGDEMFTDFLNIFREAGQLTSRVNSIELNDQSTDHYIPVFRGNYHNFSAEEMDSISTVLSVVIRKFPFIVSNFDLDRFIEFKSDNDTKLKMSRLRDWSLDMSKKKYSVKEIEQKIDYLLQEYCKQLEIHKLKYELGTMETLVTTSLEVAENIAKLNFSKAAKVLFDIGKQDINLLESENKILGKEVAIIQKANDLVN